MTVDEPMILSFPFEFLHICDSLSPGNTQKCLAKEKNGTTLHVMLRKCYERLECILSSCEFNQSTKIETAVAYDVSLLKGDVQSNSLNSTSFDEISDCGDNLEVKDKQIESSHEQSELDEEKIVDELQCDMKPQESKLPTKLSKTPRQRSRRKNYALMNESTELSVTSRSTILVGDHAHKQVSDSRKLAEAELNDLDNSNHPGSLHSSVQLDKEMNDRSDESPSGCPCIKCGKIYPTVKNMEQHVKHFHKNDPDFQQLMQRIETDRDGRSKRRSQVSVTCPLCKQERHGVRIFKHMKDSHSEDPKYEQCLRSVEAEYRVKWLQHRRSLAQKDAEIRQACHFCGKTYTRTCIRQHIKYQCRSNPDCQRMKHCTQCGFRTLYPVVLEKHVAEKHPENFKVVCEICGHTARSKSVLFHHRRKVHNIKAPNAREYICETCGKECSTSWELQSHLTSHSDERPITCPTCNKDFKTEANLKKHVKTMHSNIFPYHCSKCGLGVGKKSYLETHRCDRARRNKKSKISSSNLQLQNASSSFTENQGSAFLTNSYNGRDKTGLLSEPEGLNSTDSIQGTSNSTSAAQDQQYMDVEASQNVKTDFLQENMQDHDLIKGEEIQYVLEEVPNDTYSEVVYFQVEGEPDTIYAEDGTELVFMYGDENVS